MYTSKEERVAAVVKHAPTRKHLDGLNRKKLYKKIADLAVQVISLKTLIEKAEGRERVARFEVSEMRRERDALAKALEDEKRVSGQLLARNLELVVGA